MDVVVVEDVGDDVEGCGYGAEGVEGGEDGHGECGVVGGEGEG